MPSLSISPYTKSRVMGLFVTASYVEAGSLTQEQADMILKNVKERVAEKNGECPNCGYQFSNGGKGQRGGMTAFPRLR